MTHKTGDNKYAWLQESILRKSDVVTASRRLARELRAAFDAQQITAGKQAWITPPIWYWQDWLNRIAAAANDPGTLPQRLDGLSTAVLMEQSLQDRLSEAPLCVGGIVRQVRQAWQSVADWNLSTSELKAAARNKDERLFADVAADYQHQLVAGNWVDQSGMSAIVASLIGEDATEIPTAVVFAGFDRISPAVRRVMSALENAGSTVEVIESRQQDSAISIASFENEDAELRAAGAWARNRLMADPDAAIAIVCPRLEDNAPDKARLVREGLAPGWQYGGPRHSLAVNVSYGRRLADYALIAIALEVLRWTYEGLTSRELSVLLRSRCIAGGQLNGRSRLELALRRYPDRRWTARNLLSIFSAMDEGEDVEPFLRLVETVAAANIDSDRSTPAECVKRIDALLETMQWPGASALDSASFQLVNRWRELLNDLARIESISPQIRWSDAIRRLAALAAETIWQPEAGPGIVQILGTLEAAGIEFDAIWVSGLDASQWPPPSRPSPFISLALQRQYDMPDATPADTLAFSRQVFSRLVSAANACVLSWTQSRDDAELTASTLLDGIDAAAYSGPADPGWFAAGMLAGTQFEVLTGDNAPPVSPDERIHGGAYTVQRQRNEPFSAFVFGRLGVRLPEFIATGLSASARGNIIHNALHNLFAGLPSQADVRGWDKKDIERRIGSAADAALGEHTVHADPVLQRIIGIERNRLLLLLRKFVEVELDRHEFSIAHVEKNIGYEKFGVRLGLRIDRIDQLADGRQLIVDYKTGIPKQLADKNGDPVDLQLVVYADALDDNIGGLLIINVDSRQITYKGAGASWTEGSQDDWRIQLQSWRAIVQESIKSLAAGDARIDMQQLTSDARLLNVLSRFEEQKRAK